MPAIDTYRSAFMTRNHARAVSASKAIAASRELVCFASCKGMQGKSTERLCLFSFEEKPAPSLADNVYLQEEE